MPALTGCEKAVYSPPSLLIGENYPDGYRTRGHFQRNLLAGALSYAGPGTNTGTQAERAVWQRPGYISRVAHGAGSREPAGAIRPAHCFGKVTGAGAR